LQGKALKKIKGILIETVGEYEPSYISIRNWVTQFKLGDSSICVAPRPVRAKTVTTPEIIDQIRQLILEDGRTSAKSLAEQLGNIHGQLEMLKLSHNA
jgi:hypothetical protein